MNENPFKIGQAPKSMSREQQRAERERLHIEEPRKATPEDLEKLIAFRLAAYESEDRNKIVSSQEEYLRVKNRTHQEWEDIFLESGDRFTLLVSSGSEVVGMARAEFSKDVWELYNLFVKKEFRGIGISSIITARLLNEIRARGGKEIRAYVKEGNIESLANAESFGLRKVDTILGKLKKTLSKGFWEMKLADVNAPEVVKRINEVLDAR